MGNAYVLLSLLLAMLLTYSGIGKIRRAPRQVRVIYLTVHVPLKYFPWLAACEFAGELGLLVGLWLRPIGIAAAIGVVLYFVGAVTAHLRVGDIKGVGSAVFMLGLSAGVLVLRMLIP